MLDAAAFHNSLDDGIRDCRTVKLHSDPPAVAI
jgi:hypothetical protein